MAYSISLIVYIVYSVHNYDLLSANESGTCKLMKKRNDYDKIAIEVECKEYREEHELSFYIITFIYIFVGYIPQYQDWHYI